MRTRFPALLVLSLLIFGVVTASLLASPNHAGVFTIPASASPEEKSLYEAALEAGKGPVEGRIVKTVRGEEEALDCRGHEYLCAWLVERSHRPSSGGFMTGSQVLVGKPEASKNEASYVVHIEGFSSTCPADTPVGSNSAARFLSQVKVLDRSEVDFFTDLHTANPFTGCSYAGGFAGASRY